MKICSFDRNGVCSFGMITEGGVVDLAPLTGFTTLKEAMAGGALEKIRDLATTDSVYSLEDVVFLPVIPDANRIFCIGTNYKDHVKEAQDSGVKRVQTEYPLIFLRLGSTLVGHGQPIIKPAVSHQLDFEGELAVIISKGGRYISVDDALTHVAGYACFNDASARDWQFHTSQVIPGKNFPRTGSFGPWLVTADEIDDPQTLKIETRLNGTVVQQANTGDMNFPVAMLVSYISWFQRLEPGDVIASGTPSGVGFARTPKLFMNGGDQCVVSISGIGELTNPISDEVVNHSLKLEPPMLKST